ncbi:hypothetical protein MASR2M79_14820 [Aminivibrio sp.]
MKIFHDGLPPGDDEKARCGGVKAVYDSGPEDVIEGAEITEAVKKAVHQCSPPVARSGVHHHAARFVHYEDPPVLINNAEGNLLRFKLKAFRRRKDDLRSLLP